jgi:uncharacterized membrane protein YidH (DUF202 family)
MQDEKQTHLFTELGFDHTAKQHILSIASWAMVIVVVAVIGYVLNIVQLLTGSEETAPRSEGFDMTNPLTGNNTISSVIGILAGLFINFFLYRFATMARNGINGLNQEQLNKSFNSLKLYFVIMSVILVILFVAVILLAIGFTMKGV